MIKKKALELKRPLHGGDIHSRDVEIDFSSNVNPLGPPKDVERVLKRGIEKIQDYPDINASELKKAIAKYIGTLPQNVTLGNGSSELIKNFCEVFVAEGNVVIPGPTFSEYEYFASVYGSEIMHTQLDTKKIIETTDSDTDAIFLCNPNNPTGTIFNENEIQEVVEAARDVSAVVLLDEAYVEFSDCESFADRTREFENLVVLRSLTKFFSLAGLRIGYGAASKGLTDCMEGVRVPWNINSMAQAASIESLKDIKFIETSKDFIKKERDFLYSELSKFLKVENTHANFFLIDLDGKIKSGELKEALLKKGILIRDCSTFTGLDDNLIRVCIRRHDENIRLIEELRNVL